MTLGELGSLIGVGVSALGLLINHATRFLKKISVAYDELRKETSETFSEIRKELADIEKNKVDRAELKEYINQIVSPLTKAMDRLYDHLIVCEKKE